MQKALILSTLLLLVVPCAAQSGPDAVLVKDITPQELSVEIQKGGVTLIDVNEADNYAFAHVPGARLIAYDAITPDVLPADKSSKLVFYCWSPECPAAGMAAESAVKLGYTDVRCMHAGITGWQDAGLPTEP
ncbi:MAG: rhodanese-like domain-containing protein [Flavobacteriales bacterium]|jgi:rhodanese-related sulfurtransferase|nr:rhodanese-like domain-containing protein [Flavobacteriales bacterium]